MRNVSPASIALLLSLAPSAIGCNTGAAAHPRSDAGIVGGDAATTDAAPAIDGGTVVAPDAGAREDANCSFHDDLDFRTPVVGDCVGRIAEHVFRRAICSCTDVVLNGGAGNGVFSYDSRMGPYSASDTAAGGSIGANRNVLVVGGGVVEGSVTAVRSVDAAGGSTIRGDVVAGNDVSSGLFGRDVFAGGNVSSAMIARDLVHTPGVSVIGTTIGGAEHVCDVQVAAPCPCAPSQLIDVPSFVTDALAHHDVDATSLFTGTGDITLPAGRLYVEGDVTLAGSGQHVHVTGPTQLFVNGSLSLVGSVLFTADGEASLDVFVTRNFIINGVDNAFGNPTRPALARLYVTQSFIFNGVDNVMSASVYAPNSSAVLNGEGNVLYGSVFGNDVTLNGANSLYFDSSVSEASSSCPAPDPTPGCTRCNGCDGHQACVDGACGACRTDADCCQPLACIGGRCAPLLI